MPWYRWFCAQAMRTGYRPGKIYWDLCIVVRKLIFISISIFVDSPATQACAGVVVLVTACILQAGFVPFSSTPLNRLEMGSLGVSLFTQSIYAWAILFKMSGTWALSALVVLVVLVNVCFVVACVYVGRQLLVVNMRAGVKRMSLARRVETAMARAQSYAFTKRWDPSEDEGCDDE
jgi:hypothetical protein